MNLSLYLLIASVVGPCLLAFTAGYLSATLVSTYDENLPIAIYEAFSSYFIPSKFSDSSHSDLRIIEWNKYLSELDADDAAEENSNEDAQNNLTKNAKRLSSGSQQILVDLQYLDTVFLDSEKAVVSKFLTFVKKMGIDAFTYECHRALPNEGVRCMGYAGTETISLYTWPKLGILSLNVLCNLNDPWSSVVPLANEVFGASMTSNKPSSLWSLQQRNTSKLTWMAYSPSSSSMADDTNSMGSVEASFDIDGVHFKPASAPRSVVNDDVRQQHYDQIYSEALVHPVMFSHDNPKRVAIIGKGTGATLREVLKHKTVEKVVIVGADAESLQAFTKLYPQHSDCSTLEGIAPYCYDDARVELISDETALEWLLGDEDDDSDNTADYLFDVIVFEESDSLWSSPKITQDLFDNLSDMLSATGVFVISHGDLGSSIERNVFETLADAGFEAIHRYEEIVHLERLSFIACFHSIETRALWFTSAAELHVRMQRNLIKTVSNDIPIMYWFDDATAMIYQLPSRSVEDAFCNQPLKPFMCDEGHGFDPDVPNAPISSFAVGVSRIPGAGRGIFFQTDVAKGTFIAADESVYDILFYPSTTSIVHEMIDYLDSSEFLHYSSIFYTYLFGYGFAFEYFGKAGYLVDTGILTFINHGCNGTGVMGEGEPLISTEMTVDLERMPAELENYSTETHVYNPFIDRNNMRIITAGDKTLFDIKAGSELVDNYLRYLHEGNWKSGVLDYRAQCIASGKGVVTGYEERKSSSSASGEEFHFHPPKEPHL